MNKILLYLIIFSLKVFENALATFRIIVLNNNKKILAAILQFANTLVWIVSAGLVIVNINKDMIKVIFFALGSLVGSYLGSKLEEKLALGNSLIICITEKDISSKIRNEGFAVTVTKGNGIKNLKYILLIILPRYKIKNLLNSINKYDKNAITTIENTNIVNKKL